MFPSDMAESPCIIESKTFVCGDVSNVVEKPSQSMHMVTHTCGERSGKIITKLWGGLPEGMVRGLRESSALHARFSF